MNNDYWTEHAEIALSEAGLPPATPEQLQAIAGVIESAHEFYGQSMGHDVASANLRAAEKREHADAINAVEREKDVQIALAQKAIERVREDRDRAILAAQDARRKLAELERRIA